MYINDLEMFLKNINISQYADDTVISYLDSSQQKINTTLRENLKILAEWCEMNKLTINVDKTKSMYFGSKNNTKQIDFDMKISLNGKELQHVDHYKYLGVILDKNLNFKLHIESILTRNVVVTTEKNGFPTVLSMGIWGFVWGGGTKSPE